MGFGFRLVFQGRDLRFGTGMKLLCLYPILIMIPAAAPFLQPGLFPVSKDGTFFTRGVRVGMHSAVDRRMMISAIRRQSVILPMHSPFMLSTPPHTLGFGSRGRFPLVCRRRSQKCGTHAKKLSLEELPLTVKTEDGQEVLLEIASGEHEQELERLLSMEIKTGTSFPFTTESEAHRTLQNHMRFVLRQGDQVLCCSFLGPSFPGRSRHVASLWVVTNDTCRRRGLARLLGIHTVWLARGLEFDSVLVQPVYVSNIGAVGLLRAIGFKLISILPRSGRLLDGRQSTDGMQFWLDLRKPLSCNLASGLPSAVLSTENVSQGEHSRQEAHYETDDEKWMALALKNAEAAAENDEIPVGAVIVKGNELIAEGYNTVIKNNDPSGHAEINAIRRAAAALNNYRLDGCTLYVTLEPCSMCAGAILHSRFRRLVFGSRDLKTGCAGSVADFVSIQTFNHCVQVSVGVLQEECSQILSDFFSNKRQQGGIEDISDSLDEN